MLVVRGRRQVGKSRLVSEFVRHASVPQLYFTGSLQPTSADDLGLFHDEVARTSTLPGRDLILAAKPASWDAALRLVAAALPETGPAIVVLDEFPWLLDRDSGLEGTLQTVWDRVLEGRRVLLILIGSDLSVMQALTTHGRPLFGRPHEMVVRPFTVRDTARLLHLGKRPADAFDAQLVTGGYPRLLVEASRHETTRQFLVDQLGDENSLMCVIAGRVLDAEVPSEAQAHAVLRAIGAGERTFGNIAHAAAISQMTLQRALELLTHKGVVARDQPACVPPANQPRYRIEDSYLRFWLGIVQPSIALIERGRADLAVERLDAAWGPWRGRAIEAIVREALQRLASADPRLGGAAHVSGWWPRNNNPEVDLVGVDRSNDPRRVCFVGSIKWREESPFDPVDLNKLQADATRVPGVDHATPRVAVARTRVTAQGVTAFTAKDLIDAWP